MNGSEAACDLVLIQTSLLFLCKCRLVRITTTRLYEILVDHADFVLQEQPEDYLMV